jgi:hypothetical protein
MKNAYIICMNDSTKAVVIDDIEKAKVELKKLKKKHHNTYPYCDEYDDVFFWHLHDVPVID